MIFKKGELFCGPGGIALGAIKASANSKSSKIEHIWANDYDKSACDTFIRNICPNSPQTVLCKSVQDIDFTELKKINALTFGFPCNDFSIVGEQKGFKGNFGGLYTYGLKAINTFNPIWFLAENVGGLQNANEGEAFLKILHDLKNAGKYGYELTAHLYKFEEYGIPQKRHRIIIVGFRSDTKLKFKVPKPNGLTRTAQEAINEPPILEDYANHEYTVHSKKVIEMLKHIPPGENAWFEGIPKELQLNVKGARLSQIYKRLKPNEPAYTITGSGGGGTHVYHWKENRALTNRERARLQTFPDSYIFCGKKEKVRQQIGMAVPPDGASIVFSGILRTYDKIPYDFIESNIKIP